MSFGKKGFTVAQVFMFILTVVVFGVILTIGTKFIGGLIDAGNDAACVKLEQDLNKRVSSVAGNYGSERVYSLIVPGGAEEVCFVDYEAIDPLGNIIEDTEGIETNYPIIAELWKAKSNNVFLIPEGKICSDYDIEELAVEGGSVCLPVLSGEIELNLEGRGDAAIVKQPSP